MVVYVAGRIADEVEIRRGKQFPYQYFAAYLNVGDEVPQQMSLAIKNEPKSQGGSAVLTVGITRAGSEQDVTVRPV